MGGKEVGRKEKERERSEGAKMFKRSRVKSTIKIFARKIF